ncbi:MAG: hypothetical protein M5U26_18400 [Planctomycetota bacterium]|nr:hypothetical protein [Planctomycetota bacterium]
MAQFVHLVSEKLASAVRRRGINLNRSRSWPARGVYAMPVTPRFYISHQWLRELKRDGQRTVVGVYFRIPDDEPVLVGHYRFAHRACTAAEAAGVILKAEHAEGYEVIVPRRIEAAEIRKIRALPQVLGWRYYPGAHRDRPCGCPVCQPRGEIRSKRLREAYAASLREA